MQVLALGCVELHEIVMGPLLRTVQVPNDSNGLNNSSTNVGSHTKKKRKVASVVFPPQPYVALCGNSTFPLLPSSGTGATGKDEVHPCSLVFPRVGRAARIDFGDYFGDVFVSKQL